MSAIKQIKANNTYLQNVNKQLQISKHPSLTNLKKF